MKVEVITIGDEILIGQITDTNSQWIGRQLNNNGFFSLQFSSIGDDRDLILRTLKNAEKHADIILITGGLGPTKDDITKSTLCEYFGSKLVNNERVLSNIKNYFDRRGIRVTAENVKQALLPDNCTVVYNKNGSASGMWFEKNAKVFISMPGVPYEMKAMMTDDILPMLKNKFNTPEIHHRTVLTQGMGESSIEELISPWVEALPENMRISYLPAPGRVRLRISGSGGSGILNDIDQQIKKMLPLLGPHHYGFDEDSLAAVVGKLLTDRNLTVAVAESCTGGYLSHLLTTVSGSSKYFLGSMISYHNDLKTNWLHVSEETIAQHGAVSGPVVEEMAAAVRKSSTADYAIASSGIAGPTGGTDEKPVGTVWLGFATPSGVSSSKLILGNNRLRNIEISSLTALNMLRNKILKEDQES